MIPGVFLLTVPCTGTLFFRDLLLEHYRTSSMGEVMAEGGACITHISADALKHAALQWVPIVTTWRPPERVVASWEKRGWDLELLKAHQQAWERLVDEFDPLVVTVEKKYKSKTRNKLLTALGDKLGVELKTDWKQP